MIISTSAFINFDFFFFSISVSIIFDALKFGGSKKPLVEMI